MAALTVGARSSRARCAWSTSGPGSGAIAVALAVALRKRRVPPDDVEIIARGRVARGASTWRGRTPSPTGSATGCASRRATSCRPTARSQPFDVLLANLPYVRTAELDALAGPARQHDLRAAAGARRGTGWADGHRAAARPAAVGPRRRRRRAPRDRRRPGRGRSALELVGAVCRLDVRGDPATWRACRASLRMRRAAGMTLATVGTPFMPDDAAGHAGTGAPDPAHRARYRRHDHRRRSRDRRPDDRRRSARAMETRRRRLARDGPDGLVGDALRAGARPHRPDRRLPGRADPGDAAARLAPPRQAAAPHAAAGRGRPRDPRMDARARPRPARQPPRAVHPARRRPEGRRLLGVHGRTRRARPRPARGDRPSGDEDPRRRRAADPDRGRAARPCRVRRARRRHDLASAVPRVRRAGRLEGPGHPLAGPPAAHPARARRSRSATSGTISRCSPRSATGRRCRARPPEVRAAARYVAAATRG